MVNIIRLAKKISYKPILLGGSFYKLSAMECEKESKIDNFKIEECFKITECPIPGSISEKYYKVEYINKDNFSPFEYVDFLNTYSSYLKQDSKFLYDDNFIFFCMFNNLSLLYDELKFVDIKLFNGLPEYYLYGLTIFDKLIKLYKADKSAKSNFIDYLIYKPEDLFNAIGSSISISQEDFLCSCECMNKIFYAFSDSLFLQHIGKGGLGFVLKYIEEETYKEYNGKKISTFSGPYACKFTLNGLLENELVPSNFKHKNIVEILDSDSLFPLGYVLMPQYVGDLADIAISYNDSPQSRDYKFLNSISFQIFDVLKYLRENNFFHNDIKLDNFLLDNNNNVILTDFSLGYKGDVEYSTPYDRCTLHYCSKHILKKFVNIKGYNRVNLLKIYNDNKNKFLNSEVFNDNSLSESDFDKLNEDEKYEVLIKSIKELKDKINFKERYICIADLCDIRSGIEPSTDKLPSTDINGIKYPNNTLCRDNLYKSDYYAAALVVSFLFNGIPQLSCVNESEAILENYEKGTLKIDYSNKNMDIKLRMMLKLIADDNFFSSPRSLEQFYEKVEIYDNILKNKKNGVKKKPFITFKIKNHREIDANLLKDHPGSFLDYILKY